MLSSAVKQNGILNQSFCSRPQAPPEAELGLPHESKAKLCLYKCIFLIHLYPQALREHTIQLSVCVCVAGNM